MCYWKGLVTQAELLAKTCKTCQQLKNIRTLYGHLTPKNIPELKQWYFGYVYLIGTYIKSIRKNQPGGDIIRNNVSMKLMTMIDPATV